MPNEKSFEKGSTPEKLHWRNCWQVNGCNQSSGFNQFEKTACQVGFSWPTKKQVNDSDTPPKLWWSSSMLVSEVYHSLKPEFRQGAPYYKKGRTTHQFSQLHPPLFCHFFLHHPTRANRSNKKNERWTFGWLNRCRFMTSCCFLQLPWHQGQETWEIPGQERFPCVMARVMVDGQNAPPKIPMKNFGCAMIPVFSMMWTRHNPSIEKPSNKTLQGHCII